LQVGLLYDTLQTRRWLKVEHHAVEERYLAQQLLTRELNLGVAAVRRVEQGFCEPLLKARAPLLGAVRRQKVRAQHHYEAEDEDEEWEHGFISEQ
jgi:hypothetical protein